MAPKKVYLLVPLGGAVGPVRPGDGLAPVPVYSVLRGAGVGPEDCVAP